jgi:hypothetical protein
MKRGKEAKRRDDKLKATQLALDHANYLIERQQNEIARLRARLPDTAPGAEDLTDAYPHQQPADTSASDPSGVV